MFGNLKDCHARQRFIDYGNKKSMKILLTLLLLAFSQIGSAQRQLEFQTGHTNDILRVRFSPDDSRLVSYSWGDGWLCYWDVRSGQLLWKSKTSFVQKADEHSNLEDFGWNQDQSLIYSKSENGTFQTWDAKTGRILSVSATNPDDQAFIKKDKKFLVTADYSNFYLVNSETDEKSTIKVFSRTHSVYDVANNGQLFAEGGSFGDAVIRLTEIRNPTKFYDLRGGRIPPYRPTELENKLLEEQNYRRAILDDARARRDQQGAIDTENFKKQVYISFEHYGYMTDPGQLRMLESDEPNKSKVKTQEAEANAIWLRLHNDSPLPVKIPTQNMYLPNPKCFYEFSNGQKILGLCDNKEIAVWFSLEDKKGKQIPYGFDFGSSAVLLPKTSALFAVPYELLGNGKAIRFEFTFQSEAVDGKPADYGTSKVLRFREADLPKSKSKSN